MRRPTLLQADDSTPTSHANDVRARNRYDKRCERNANVDRQNEKKALRALCAMLRAPRQHIYNPSLGLELSNLPWSFGWVVFGGAECMVGLDPSVPPKLAMS